MKVLFISNLYPPNTIGGYERLCYDVTSAFVYRNMQVDVLTSSYGGRHMNYSGQSIDRSLKLLATEGNIYQPFSCSPGELARFNEQNVSLLKEKVKAQRPDILFVWNLHFFDRSLLDAIQQTGCKVLFLLTDNWMISFLNASFWGYYFSEYVHGNSSFRGRLQMALRRLLNKYRSNAEFRIRGYAIFASRFMQELYTEAGLRFAGSTIIHNGVHLDCCEGDTFTDRKSLLRHGELRLLIAGRIVDMKGVHTAIQALPHVISALPGFRIKLTILGEGQDRQYLKQLNDLIHDLDISDHVEFMSPVSEGELFAFFQKYDLYLFPSLYEPFSLTLIHALASGIPTIASDAGGNKEIVHHRKTGLLFAKGNAMKLSDAIVELVRNSEMRVSISLAARQLARDYTFEKMVSRIEDYIATVQ
jgi:glycosyltransferase involved in cell wall biosynthesis